MARPNPTKRPFVTGQQKQGSAKPVAAPKSPLPPITPLPTTSVLGPVSVNTPPARSEVWDNEINIPFFTYQMKVFIPEGVLDIYGSKPHTKAEIKAKYETVRDFGAVFQSADGLTSTTYMPKTIAKIIVILTPYTGGSVENQ